MCLTFNYIIPVATIIVCALAAVITYTICKRRKNRKSPELIAMEEEANAHYQRRD